MPLQTVFRHTLHAGINGIHATQEPIPTPGATEILVRVRSVALNYRDVAIATSTYPLPTADGVVPTSDMAGEVVQIGTEVVGFAPGDRVVPPLSAAYLYGPFREGVDAYGSVVDGMLREYVVLPASILVKLPESSLRFSQWAAAVCTGSTVWNAFYGNMPLKPGDTVLLQGTGGVSMTGLVLAKAAGAKTIITSSSDEKLEYARSLGADHTINYKTHPHWAAEVLRITNGQGVDHIIENGGLGTIEQSVECVTASGTISLVGFLADTGGVQPTILIPALIKAVVIRGVRGGSKHQLEELVRFMGSSKLATPVNKEFGFNREEIIAAFKYVEFGKHIGKVCINLN